MLNTLCSVVAAALILPALVAIQSPVSAGTIQPVVKVVEVGESKTPPQDCRATIVGPGINQPDPFPGYNGFVGWESPVRLKDGTWLVGFSVGYWHGAWPTPYRDFSPGSIESYHSMGMPKIDAPTGGRAMLVCSKDNGKTWSKPQTIIDSPADDRVPHFLQLPDSTLLCCFNTSWSDNWHLNPMAHKVGVIRSHDGGYTWEQNIRRLPSDFGMEETDGPMVLAKDGSVYLVVSGAPKDGGKWQAGIFRSTDLGKTWQRVSVIKSGDDLLEPSITQLPSGRFVFIARPEGTVCFSDDRGHTWTPPAKFGMRMYSPSLYVLRDGTLVCLHGSYSGGGLRMIFSTDGGKTWIAPAKDHGFLIDNAYGYGKAMELPDGSMFFTYIKSGGHATIDAETNSVWCIKARIRPDHSGIDLLPAPNRVPGVEAK